MEKLAKIDEEVISAEKFVKILSFRGILDDLLQNIVSDKLAVHEARKRGVTIPVAELQQGADDFRRVRGLHRAKDARDYLKSIDFSVEEFEALIEEDLLKDKMIAQIASEKAVEEYFKLNSPKFESVELSQIVVDAKDKAKEITAILTETPDRFGELAREHSLVEDSRERGGVVGRVMRGSLPDEMEAKVFRASAGEVVGHFSSEDGDAWEILMVTAKHPPQLDEGTRAEIKRLLHEEWLEAQSKAHAVEMQ